MKLSVITAVRNGQEHLRAAVESVLAQSMGEFEFLIVDDASSDATPDILRDFQRRDSRISVLRNGDCLGPYPSANRALLRARGQFVARHDGDDVSPPDRFAVQIKALESDEGVSLVTGAVDYFGATPGGGSTIARPPAWQPRLEWDLLFHNAVGAGAHVMFPRVVRGAPVLFRARHPYAEDYELWCRLSRLGQILCPDEVVYRYRRHASSISTSMRQEQFECMSQMRHEYQTEYCRSPIARAVADDLSRFWTGDGSRPLGTPIGEIGSVLDDLRSNFLVYVEQRFGRASRASLEAALEAELSARLGYWLYRSCTFYDRRAVVDVLSLARVRRDTMNVADKALRLAAGALRRKSAWRQRADAVAPASA